MVFPGVNRLALELLAKGVCEVEALLTRNLCGGREGKALDGAAVPDHKNVLVALALQEVVGNQALALVLREVERLDHGARRYSCAPHTESKRDFFSSGKRDFCLANFLYSRPNPNFNAHLLKVGHRAADDSPVKRCQKLCASFEQSNFYHAAVEMRVVPRDISMHKIAQFSTELNAGWASSHDHKTQKATSRVIRYTWVPGGLEACNNSLANLTSIRELLEEDSIFQNTRHTKRAGNNAQSDYKGVVWQLERHISERVLPTAVDMLVLWVNFISAGPVVGHVFLPGDVTNRLDN
mmetsp:Transcript_9671/g.22191  ORF Transcript_9671/g.22191 Transcript_9671/m.22191 type:complete len:294 (-) Transcript_9671:238-1119(-)